MKHIQPMNVEQLALYLLDMSTDDVVEFGLDPGSVWPDKIPDSDDVSDWYFAKKMYIPGYGSRFVLLDYAGGGEAWAIPLSEFPADDKSYVLLLLYEYLDNRPCAIDGELFVFVEMEDEK